MSGYILGSELGCMTVAELKWRLESVRADLEVMIEGCDCYGWAEDVVISARCPPGSVKAPASPSSSGANDDAPVALITRD